MKPKIIIFFLLILPIRGFPFCPPDTVESNFMQTYYNTSFEHWWQFIQFSQEPGDCWQVGVCNKIGFESGIHHNVLVTDTANLVLGHSKSVFEVQFHRPPLPANSLNEYNFQLSYLCQTGDSACGIVEISYNEGNTWASLDNDNFQDPPLPPDDPNWSFFDSLPVWIADTLGAFYGYFGDKQNWKYNLYYRDFGSGWELDGAIYNVYLRFSFYNFGSVPVYGMMIDSLFFHYNTWDEFLAIPEIEILNSEELTPAPNPVTGTSIIGFENPTNQKVLFNVYDLWSRKIQSLEYWSGQIKLNRNEYNPGVYTYKIICTNKTYNGKFIVR